MFSLAVIVAIRAKGKWPNQQSLGLDAMRHNRPLSIAK